jgi:hypothetical protein
MRRARSCGVVPHNENSRPVADAFAVRSNDRRLNATRPVRARKLCPRPRHGLRTHRRPQTPWPASASRHRRGCRASRQRGMRIMVAAHRCWRSRTNTHRCRHPSIPKPEQPKAAAKAKAKHHLRRRQHSLPLFHHLPKSPPKITSQNHRTQRSCLGPDRGPRRIRRQRSRTAGCFPESNQASAIQARPIRRLLPIRW